MAPRRRPRGRLHVVGVPRLHQQLLHLRRLLGARVRGPHLPLGPLAGYLRSTPQLPAVSAVHHRRLVYPAARVVGLEARRLLSRPAGGPGAERRPGVRDRTANAGLRRRRPRRGHDLCHSAWTRDERALAVADHRRGERHRLLHGAAPLAAALAMAVGVRHRRAGDRAPHQRAYGDVADGLDGAGPPRPRALDPRRRLPRARSAVGGCDLVYRGQALVRQGAAGNQAVLRANRFEGLRGRSRPRRAPACHRTVCRKCIRPALRVGR